MSSKHLLKSFMRLKLGLDFYRTLSVMRHIFRERRDILVEIVLEMANPGKRHDQIHQIAL